MAETGRIRPENTQFVLVSFEGPDGYSLAGGLGTRMRELAESLAALGFETHLYFVGDPKLPAVEKRCDDRLTLHRWCQWISAYHPLGVYDGEQAKIDDMTRSLPAVLLDDHIAPGLKAKKKRRTVVLAEEWHTAWATMALSDLLHERGLRRETLLLWNANNNMGCERIPWPRLNFTATVTTVSRFMKQQLWGYGTNPIVIPNGIPERLLAPPPGDPAEVRGIFGDRSLLVKVGRFDPDKRWIQAVHALAGLKRDGTPAVMLMRGGIEPHGEEVLWNARNLGLTVADVRLTGRPSMFEALDALRTHADADILNLRFFVPEELLRLMYAGADAVLANSGYEPFGLVGLEAMAEGGIAFTGATGEDYATSYENAICIETDDAREIAAALTLLRRSPDLAASIRREARRTAERYTWTHVIENLCHRLETLAYEQGIALG
jgi:glycosyltransferase involved in cell wall biosynthesis